MIAERAITFLKVEGYGIMQRASDFVSFQMFLQFIAARMADDVKMVHAFRVVRFPRQLQRGVGEQFMIALRHASSSLGPLCQVLQLYTENGTLNSLHSIIEPDLVVVIALSG